ncbi:hypothetical protein JVX98_07450 (plasmid) [Ensifer sp. PDNC004]|uniref:hypothetical protein n=1 Tax=Ensifer sp. PDNC004 TaxID=2811423 RepID=UPI001966490B|nr:hypothetical protein [Ensifer sp. PDNC004]QRY65460.1 hypothetical protein JVX98_07450 [Ensifer sp. PDNC004]
MVIKAKWTDADFNNMGWHDCRLYAIKLLDQRFNLSFDIDYMFRWHQTGFDISPCVLTFFNVFDLKINLDYDGNLLCFISDINRLEARSPNGTRIWLYGIECNVGSISFSATGFEQTVKAPPTCSETQDLNRGHLVME